MYIYVLVVMKGLRVGVWDDSRSLVICLVRVKIIHLLNGSSSRIHVNYGCCETGCMKSQHHTFICVYTCMMYDHSCQCNSLVL